MTARLITIPFSHYCEKARWALDHAGVAYAEEGHLPAFSSAATLRAGAKRTVPALIDGKTVLPDSTPIIAYADQHHPGSLYPTAAQDREDVLGIEDELDRNLGPATRRWAYFHLIDRKDLDHLLLRNVPRWEQLAFKAGRPAAMLFLKRGLELTPEGAARSRQKIDEAFQNVGGLLGDGRRYLIGDRFTVADLTFAALAAPVLAPPQYGATLPPIEAFPPAARAQVDIWRGSPPGQFALRIYAEHRRSPR